MGSSWLDSEADSAAPDDDFEIAAASSSLSFGEEWNVIEVNLRTLSL